MMRYLQTLILALGFCSSDYGWTVYIPLDFQTIQEGVDVVENGDTVIVLPGDYPEYINFHGKRILLVSEAGPDSTFIKQVKFYEGTDTTTVLRGFTVSGSNESHVALIRVNGVSSGVIEGNIVRDHSNYQDPGGIDSDGDYMIIRSNIILNNRAQYLGGGKTEISNNTFVKNRCYGYQSNAGSGMYISSGDSVRIINNIFAHNYQGGVWTDVTLFYVLDYKLAWENDYGDYQGFEPGPNSLFDDPLFVDRWNGDYHLQAGCPVSMPGTRIRHSTPIPPAPT